MIDHVIKDDIVIFDRSPRKGKREISLITV